MRDTGVNVGLGVDGTASNDAGHLLAEMRLAFFLQRGGNADTKGEAVRLFDRFWLCTINLGRVLGITGRERGGKDGRAG